MYDITIIGAGVSSVFLAYTLLQTESGLSIHIIDKGKELSERKCGLDEGKSCECEDGCSKYIGFAGLGMSEGKFNYTNDFGGELGKKIGKNRVSELMKEVDEILCYFGAEQVDLYSTKNESLAARASAHSLKVLSTEVRHLGSNLALEVFQNMYESIKDRITFTFSAQVESLIKKDCFTIGTNQGNFHSEKLVLATGMSGSEWLASRTASLGLYPGKTRLDLGLRVEMKGDQLDSILKETFETKLQYRDRGYTSTTYCMNPKGRIIRKYQHGLVMADGQNQHEKEVPSTNLNFTLFTPRHFHSYDAAMKEAKRVIGGINDKRERVVVQRLEDLKKNTATSCIENNLIRPSLKGDTGNLNDEVPGLYIETLLHFFEALEGLMGETIHPDTLLYGMDAKFYEPKIYTNEKFETEIPGLYLAGDCSGDTHSLSQAAASGIYLGKLLRQKN
ncbi:NAD(FAD)-utilizing dehydrogenase [Halobacillus sp. A1]|uniref:NAD(FAD)-utilizing dehydrogenase n=1 Tax=Halobacillus sp. A1 TaxID=2880262 RepID=UPI0020A66C3E|nr:NAD(FAD)-utilizing dehydrogenase [Halobacillus sp. A1]MCP3031898.1 NAD(FAD)-utilizing dehydrogenase [Halobacillus sp. A1]